MCAPLAGLFRGTGGGDACQSREGRSVGRPAGTKRRLGEREKSFLSAASHPSECLSIAHISIRCIERARTHKVRLGCSQSALSCAILVMHRPLPLNARCPQQKLTWLFVSLSLSLSLAFSSGERARSLITRDQFVGYQRRTAPALSRMASIFESATNNDCIRSCSFIIWRSGKRNEAR